MLFVLRSLAMKGMLCVGGCLCSPQEKTKLGVRTHLAFVLLLLAHVLGARALRSTALLVYRGSLVALEFY